MLTHTVQKSFVCCLCGYKCSNVGNLKNHMFTHTGEKRFSCEICDHKFSRRCDLKTHMRTHTREKRFSCELCDYKCNRRYTLKCHMLKHTRKDTQWRGNNFHVTIFILLTNSMMIESNFLYYVSSIYI